MLKIDCRLKIWAETLEAIESEWYNTFCYNGWAVSKAIRIRFSFRYWQWLYLCKIYKVI